MSQLLPFPRWNPEHAATLDEPGLLLYRSNLLGSDLRITNYGGGNTSAKIKQKDPLSGEWADVLWVKGSGGDIGSMKLDGFATLYLDKLHALRGLYRGLAYEDDMVGYLPHCTFNLNPRAASIHSAFTLGKTRIARRTCTESSANMTRSPSTRTPASTPNAPARRSACTYPACTALRWRSVRVSTAPR